MASITLRRAVVETIGSFTAAGTASNDYRVPSEMMGARMAWQTVITGAPTAVSAVLQASLDGVNWFAFDTSTNLTGEVRVVVIQGVAAIRANLGTLTGGTTPTVTFLARAQ